MIDKLDTDKVKPVLENIMTDLDNYDISTFKQRMRDLMEAAETRPAEDQTDFSFLNRRESDR